jgi:hypothetical protein
LKPLAIDFVSLPIVSLALCIAIPDHPAFAAKLHLGCTSRAAVVARMCQVLGLDAYFAVARGITKSRYFVGLIQQHDTLPPIVARKTGDNGKFAIVCCISETLKPDQLSGLESSHLVTVLSIKNCVRLARPIFAQAIILRQQQSNRLVKKISLIFSLIVKPITAKLSKQSRARVRSSAWSK